MKYNIVHTSEIITGEAEIDPQGCCSICFENLGTSTAYIYDVIPVSPTKIREFTNEPNCHMLSKIRISYRGTYDKANRNTEQILVVKTFAFEKK